MAAQRGNNHESSQSATHERVSVIHSSMGPVGAFDNSPLHLTIEKFNDKNYREWAQAINLVIDGKGNHWQDLHVPPDGKGCVGCDMETYSGAKNASQIFEIKTRLWQMKQEDREVTEYYTEMLARLNCELDDVRSRVLSRRSLPSIREVFSEVQQEESRRRVMLDLLFGPEASALLTHGPHGPHATAGCGPHVAGSSGPSPRQSKRAYCEH
ncbi:hypothetical protein CK203_095616 [Vitis vinifera]|uniref:Retrotransposon Copia-like N-terminal domain-containing protein n=1 Tax=Vitis vinifera TaxID=29760 RepID=A0A438FGW0_VITVI|nr:hypothetical protein CK203_095616 [Vitis vinifera]